MMTPDQISEMTLAALRAAREAMMSAEWSLEMDAASPEIRRQGGLLLGMVQGEILRLENAQLAAIAAALVANGAALQAAARDVQKEVKQIAKIAKVLKAVDDLVKLAIKVAPKAMGLMGAARRAPAPASARPKRKTAAKPAAKKAAKKAKPKPAARPAAGRGAPKPKRKAPVRRRTR